MWSRLISQVNINIYKTIINKKVHLFFKRNKVNLNQQIKVFEAQLLIANEMNLPIVIHCRENELEVFEILKKVSFRLIINKMKLSNLMRIRNSIRFGKLSLI